MNEKMEPSRDQSAYYFTKDLVDNLQIRVSLQQLTGTQLVDASPRVVEDTSGVRDVEFSLMSFPVSAVPPNDNGSTYIHQQVIKWQQKILSACEALEYGLPEYANHPKYKAWHEQAIKMKKRKQWKRRLFTYIHQDDYQYQVQDAVTTSKRQEQECWIRQRKNITIAGTSHRNNNTDLNEGIKEVDKKTAKMHELRQLPQQQYFYIMADLAPSDSLGKSRAHEVVLCALHYNVHGQLIVTPDFTKPTTKAYRLESFGSDNALYEYTVENVSLTHSGEKSQDTLVKQMEQQRQDEMQQIIGLEWNEQQPEGELRMLIVGEITRALHFTEATSLYIHYVLHLPPGWKANHGAECEGFTPTCTVGYIDSTHTAHYSTPFSIDVTRSKSGQGWPQLLLAAFSVDWLGQDRDEGYAAFVLPTPEKNTKNGVYSVNTWRPAQSSPLTSLRRFFLGGSQLIADSSYLALSSTTEKGRISRLGFVTLTSGSIELKINTLVQKDWPKADIVRGENSAGWQLTTLAIISAFNRSRQRLRAAKQGLL